MKLKIGLKKWSLTTLLAALVFGFVSAGLGTPKTLPSSIGIAQPDNVSIFVDNGCISCWS